MEEPKTRSGAWLVLKWMVLLTLNIAVVVLIPILFLYTQSAPVTPEGLAGLEYFSGCDILTVAGRRLETDSAGNTGYTGDSLDSWVLYENSAGEVRAVCLEWDLIAPRYRVRKSTDTLIPAGEEKYSFHVVGLGSVQNVTVSNHSRLQLADSGGEQRRKLAKMGYCAGVAALLALEFGAVKLVRRARRNRLPEPLGEYPSE